MNEWLKKMIGKFKDFWKNSSIVKKVILVGVVAVIAVVIIVTAKVSARPDTVRLYDTPVTDESMRSQIVVRLNQENVQAEVDSAGYISIGKNENKDRLFRFFFRKVFSLRLGILTNSSTTVHGRIRTRNRT